MKDLELNSYVIQDISSCLRMLKPYGIIFSSPNIYFPNMSKIDDIEIVGYKNELDFSIIIAKTKFLINVPLKSVVSFNDNTIDFQFPNGDYLVIALDKEIETLKNGLNVFNRKDIFKESLKESKKSARKSIKENKMILSFEAFKDICVEEIGYSYIGSFDEYKGTYFVSVIDDKRADKFCKYLRNNYDCECTFWKITDPYDDDYGLYRVEVI